MGTEELLIFRIQNEIRSLRLKTKTIDQVTINARLIRLRKTNPNMADELEDQYMNVLSRFKDDKYQTEKEPLKRKW
jgi:hypothetical protein